MKKIKNKGSLKKPKSLKIPNQSIKKSIGIWYLILYLAISVVCILFMFFYYYLQGVERLNTDALITNEGVSEIINQGTYGNESYYRENLYNINESITSENMAIVMESGEYYFAIENEIMDEYIMGINNNYMFNLFPIFSLIHEGYIVNVEFLDINEEMVSVMTFYDAIPYMRFIMDILRPISFIFIFGGIVMFLFGYAKLDKMITAENLDLRLDVKNTRYELKELAKTTNEMIDSFQSSYEKQERFVSDVSHELKTPISIVTGYGNILKRWGSKDEDILNESIDSIISESKNMENLVKKLLFLAKYDKNETYYDFRKVNLSDMLMAVVKDINVAKKINIKREIEKDVFIIADEIRIKEVFVVFIDNAIKYTTVENKEICLSLKSDNENVYVSVEDNGVGIKKEDLKNIFDRFYRSDKSRNKETGGFGLGLNIAKSIITDHKGRIKVITKENEGSKFIITIPKNLDIKS